MAGMKAKAPQPVGIQCPRCINSRMLEQRWNGVRLQICMNCGANWFAAGDLAAWEGWGKDIPLAAERGAQRRPAKVSCPSCNQTMERLTFPFDPPLQIDRCASCHGVLLDFEEIRRVPELGRWAAERARASRSA
jgi:Zn-finger nucleic acid-binding protein